MSQKTIKNTKLIKGILTAKFSIIINSSTDLPKDVFISHGADIEAALSVKEQIEDLGFGFKVTLINHIGPVIGAHAGPGTIAVFYATQR
ncbi:MAG TPA: hypothetical protein GX003_02285 [Acholeplasmataceae bacterium]|nr:hypothetical protein [Acholeplasmataceae bacterium]